MSSSPLTATAATAAVPWYRTVTREQWRVLLAAKFGWMLDAMDFMLYTMAVGQLRMYFGFGDDTAGMLGTVETKIGPRRERHEAHVTTPGAPATRNAVCQPYR